MIAGVTGGLFQVVTGTATAEELPVKVPAPKGYQTTDFTSVDEFVVDGVHKHVLVTDPADGRLVALNYNGTTAAEALGLPGARGAALSTDSTTIYVAVENDSRIAALDAVTLQEIRSFPMAGEQPVGVAVSGSRLWFTTKRSNFGELDLVTGEVRLHDHGETNPWDNSGELMLAVNPANPAQLAVTTHAVTSGAVGLFDISGAVAERIGLRGYIPSNDVYDFNDLRFTTNGLALGGSNGVLLMALDADLTTTGRIATNWSVGLDVAATGWVATARPYFGNADILLLPAGATTATRELVLPTNQFQGGFDALAWEPGGDRLAVLTSSALGAEQLWVSESPTVDTATIALTAPANATRGAALTITGTAGSVPAGTSLTVSRTDLESPSGTALAAVTTGESGAFSFTDKPPAGGTVTYTVSFAGTADIRPASATASVSVSREIPALTLVPAGTVNTYNTAVTVTAKLGSTYRNRTVELWADPAGSDKANTLLKRATVDAAGKVTASLRLTRNTVISAVFTGDTRVAPRTVKSTLHAKVSAVTAVTKHYKTASGYFYFRKTKNPVFTTTMTPGAGRKQRLQFEYYSGGKWRTWKGYTLPLNSAGKSVYKLTGTHKTGVKYRVRTAYIPGTSGDSLNHTTYGAYRYFTFTK
ncbi:hypothetical protein Adi01nite_28010 [Amorphoplanes digitatis]|nr:hypothetical protein Adi01nite_28010 [Actinoplanes digitatis]